jgi:hypothetical protein
MDVDMLQSTPCELHVNVLLWDGAFLKVYRGKMERHTNLMDQNNIPEEIIYHNDLQRWNYFETASIRSKTRLVGQAAGNTFSEIHKFPHY